jgi:DnaK suppressor protein
MARGLSLPFHMARRQDVKTSHKKAVTAKKVAAPKAAAAKKTVAAKKAVAVKKSTAVKPAAPAKGQPKTKAVAKVAVKSKKPAAPAPSVKTAKVAASPKTAAVKTSSKAVASSPKKSPVAAPKTTAAPKAKLALKLTSPKMTSVPETKPMTVRKVATPTPEVTPVAEKAAPVAADQLVRATRPSARLAQITVPSLPPAVASTAAKASFMPSAAVATVSAPFAPIKKDTKLANNWKTKPVDDLSDAEILAMPDAEYMNNVQMAYFRRKLAQLKQEILNSAGATTEHLREDTVVVPDPADRATIEEEHALELRTRDRERKLLKKIEQSIALIDAGDYGYCDETGEPIGVGRLLARPTATLSLEAQQRRELKQKMFGD